MSLPHTSQVSCSFWPAGARNLKLSGWCAAQVWRAVCSSSRPVALLVASLFSRAAAATLTPLNPRLRVPPFPSLHTAPARPVSRPQPAAVATATLRAGLVATGFKMPLDCRT